MPWLWFLPGWYPRYHPGSRANLRPFASRLPRALSTGETHKRLTRGRCNGQPDRPCLLVPAIRAWKSPTTAWQRSDGGSRAIFTVDRAPALTIPGSLCLGVSTATRLRRCLYFNKCMTSHRDLPRTAFTNSNPPLSRQPVQARSVLPVQSWWDPYADSTGSRASAYGRFANHCIPPRHVGAVREPPLCEKRIVPPRLNSYDQSSTQANQRSHALS